MRDSRPIIFLASASWYGGRASSHCIFSSRADAVQWAKSQARTYGGIDFATWTTPQGEYPEETARDNEQLDPTWVCKWTRDGGGEATVEKTRVCMAYDWSARPPVPETPAEVERSTAARVSALERQIRQLEKRLRAPSPRKRKEQSR